MRKTFFISAILLSVLLFSCKKDSASNNSSNGNYSHWALAVTNNYDNGSYTAHPNNIINAQSSFDNTSTLSCDGFVDSSGTYTKEVTINIQFLAKPTASGTYTIGDPNNLTSSTCSIYLSSATYNSYTSSSFGQTLNVTVNGGLVTVSFNNISLIGTPLTSNTPQWAATVSGTVFEGR